MIKHDPEKYPERDSLTDRLKLQDLVLGPAYDLLAQRAKELPALILDARNRGPGFDSAYRLQNWLEFFQQELQAGHEAEKEYEGYTLREFLDRHDEEMKRALERFREVEYANQAAKNGGTSGI